jgi:hypothetical protein
MELSYEPSAGLTGTVVSGGGGGGSTGGAAVGDDAPVGAVSGVTGVEGTVWPGRQASGDVSHAPGLSAPGEVSSIAL